MCNDWEGILLEAGFDHRWSVRSWWDGWEKEGSRDVNVILIGSSVWDTNPISRKPIVFWRIYGEILPYNKNPQSYPPPIQIPSSSFITLPLPHGGLMPCVKANIGSGTSRSATDLCLVMYSNGKQWYNAYSRSGCVCMQALYAWLFELVTAHNIYQNSED